MNGPPNDRTGLESQNATSRRRTQAEAESFDDVLQAGYADDRAAGENNRGNCVDKKLGEFGKKIDELAGCLTRMEQELGRIKTDDHVLTQMHDRNQELTEQFHEREVLMPVIKGLIGIADRSRAHCEKIRSSSAHSSAKGSHSARVALRHLLEAREADGVEIESLLASLDVERFEHASQVFDPRKQTCIERVLCEDESLDGQIAQKHQPGYRRHERVIRPEIVSVYSCSSRHLEKGTQS